MTILLQTAVIVVQITALLRPRTKINKCMGKCTFLLYNTTTLACQEQRKLYCFVNNNIVNTVNFF